MALTPDEESDLRWVADGSAEADLGMRSWLGPMQAKGQAGQLRCQSSPGEGRDCGPAAERLMRVRRRLDEAEARGPGSARVLLAWFGPNNTRVLPGYKQLGLVMALCSDLDATELEADGRRALKGDRAAMGRMASLRSSAEAAVAGALAAYASTRPPPKPDPARDVKRADARRAKEGERRGHFAGRTDEDGAVVFEGPARRRAG